MPRRTRMYESGLPYHIVQRGNNREACFYEVDDYSLYLKLLSELLPRYQVYLHAYVLMTNHIHFLMTPEESDSISNLMRVLGSRYAQKINKRYERTGTMWEGRHKSSVVDSESYLLKCYRYIELNPVTASMVDMPEEYRWSSYGVNAWGDESTLVTAHDEYLKLGNTYDERSESYRELFSERLSASDISKIRLASHYCQPLGDDLFKKQIEEKIGRPVGQQRRGRPRKIEPKQ